MNATALAQSEFDNRLPPPVSESPQELARAEWLFNSAEQLIRFGCDVTFQRRMRKPQGVTVADLALAVDEHVNGRLAGCQVQSPALGWLLLSQGKPDQNAVAELLGPSDHPLGKRGEIAEGLLRPLVADAMIAQAEDNEL
ncbi:hypothetical protein [Pseudomonas sp. Irchel 3E20]|uniref:hypothetical protein n=1 Tax=Pseudomonas sp. Irchel 3E20 TaxID=2008983 RepID=UPI000BA2E096|nr:hypothetical protein [Pseudomonas sp. Irchel 3E20]